MSPGHPGSQGLDQSQKVKDKIHVQKPGPRIIRGQSQMVTKVDTL